MPEKQRREKLRIRFLTPTPKISEFNITDTQTPPDSSSRLRKLVFLTFFTQASAPSCIEASIPDRARIEDKGHLLLSLRRRVRGGLGCRQVRKRRLTASYIFVASLADAGAAGGLKDSVGSGTLAAKVSFYGVRTAPTRHAGRLSSAYAVGPRLRKCKCKKEMSFRRISLLSSARATTE